MTLRRETNYRSHGCFSNDLRGERRWSLHGNTTYMDVTEIFRRASELSILHRTLAHNEYQFETYTHGIGHMMRAASQSAQARYDERDERQDCSAHREHQRFARVLLRGLGGRHGVGGAGRVGHFQIPVRVVLRGVRSCPANQASPSRRRQIFEGANLHPKKSGSATREFPSASSPNSQSPARRPNSSLSARAATKARRSAGSPARAGRRHRPSMQFVPASFPASSDRRSA